MVGFGLDYAYAHIIIPASVNLLPIQADFVTERDTLAHVHYNVTFEPCAVVRRQKAWNIFIT